MKTQQLPGLVVATYGRHCLVETADGERLICHPRGKKNQAVVGDRVWWQPSGDEGSIEKLQERRNLLYRQDEWRSKSFVQSYRVMRGDDEIMSCDEVRIFAAHKPEGGIRAVAIPPEFIALCS